MEIQWNADVINRCTISRAQLSGDAFSVQWISANEAKNRDTLNFRRHQHSFFEIHFILKGNIVYGIRDRLVTVQGGEFVTISPFCPHRVVSCSAEFEKLTLAVECESDKISAALIAAEYQVLPIGKEMILQLGLVFYYANKMCENRDFLIKHTLHALIYHMISLRTPTSGHREERYDDRVLKAKKYVEDNYDILFTCEVVAAYCHISAKQLGRLFKKHEGMGLLEFIHRTKLEQCKKMLLETDYTQHRIAQMLGFSGADYFNKFFVHKTGVTPMQFRDTRCV
ncbi:MAG: AraC family transcriptional regulator [Clostridia bacterium]|nr:AraC family transcriptional regulator [Clostridia bacterium]